MAGGSVAVIGLGTLGLVAVKNLVEEGFDVTGFDRNGYVGGLWRYTEDDTTSVLPSTVVNISKQRGCFTDFPFPDEVGNYPTSSEVHEYLLAYTKHFNLQQHLRLGVDVSSVARDEDAKKWIVRTKDGPDQSFDRVVVPTGANALPNVPDIPGLDHFKGEAIHSRSFKRPSNFKDKSVLVVGFANTAADTASELVGHAKQIYLSHQHGCIVMPRIVNGKPIDHTLTMRFAAIQDILTAYFPAVAENMFNKVAKGIQDKAFKLRPEWRFEPATSLKQSVPIVSDYLVSHLESGAIRSVAGIERISGPSSVQLSDGTTLEVDTIIWCTGYKTDFSFLNASYDPTKNITSAWAQSKGSNNKPLARLYQNIFSLRAPNSLAFLGTVAFPSPAFQAYDLATMAIAQVWKGASPLPGQAAMEEEVDAHHQWVISLAQRGTVYPGIVQPGPWMRWVNEAAGTGVNEMLGYGPKGWKFWWGDGKFCTMCYDGILSPHVFRVFEGKRKRWHGARQAIEKVNCK